MNFSELKTELFARGADYLNEDSQGVARAERWLNQAYREILNLQSWPFLSTNTTGTASAGFVSIPDLRKIQLVADADTAQPLKRATYEELAREYDDVNLEDTGTPEFYYALNVAGDMQIWSYPVGGTIFVQYIKRVDSLSGTDEPIFDEEYHDLIVDRAMMKVYKDSDNFEAAAALKQEFDAGVAAMAEDYLLVSREVTFIPVDPYDG